MATIPMARAAYQHPTFNNTTKDKHPLSKEQRDLLRSIRETIDRMENATRNKQALLLRLNDFNARVAAFRRSLHNQD